MSLLWPDLLWALALTPLIAAAYFWLQRRRRRATVRFSSLSLVQEAASAHSWWRRYLPAVLRDS